MIDPNSKPDSKESINQRFESDHSVEEALRVAMNGAVAMHKRLKNPFPIYVDGKVVLVTPTDEDEVPDPAGPSS